MINPKKSAFNFLFLLFYSCFFPVAAMAQPSNSGNPGIKRFDMLQLDTEPVIDGVMDEAIWQQATLITDLYQVSPVEFAEPTQPTEIRIFYTEDAIFVAARMWDSEVEQITAQILQQYGNIGNDDIFNIMLDPYRDSRSGYRFAINANGVLWDAIYKSPTDMESNWQGIWQGNSSIDEEGWTTEVRIPFQTLSFNPQNSDWGINFQRNIRRNNESISWYSRDRQFNPGVAGVASGMQGMEQGIGLDVVPGLTLRRERVYGTGPGTGVEENFEPTLDVFYKLTSSLNASLTVNTDFSAAEVDDRQVNLTRFSLFFPEKRDFFLRDSDIFEFGQIGSYGFNNRDGTGNSAFGGAKQQNGRPFFSRTIGLSAQGAPVDITAGSKLSGRIGRFNVGSLLIAQDADAATGVDSREVFVGRAVMNVLSESQVGVMLTDGDPQSNLDSTLLGADFRYRNSQLPNDKTIEANAWVQKTDTTGKQGNDMAYSLALSAPNNIGWRGTAVYSRIEQNFDPAVGFVSQTGIENLAMNGGYTQYLRSGSYLRNIYYAFDAYRSELLSSGQLSSEEFGPRIALFNQQNDKFFTQIVRQREVLINDFTIFRASDGSRTVVIPQDEYEFMQWRGILGTAGQRPLSMTLNFNIGEYYDGDHQQFRLSTTWRPTRQYEFGVSYSEDAIELPAGDFNVRLISVDANVTFNTRWSWSNYLQYDNVSESVGFNSRLNWVPTPGQQGYLVLNYGAQDRDKDNNFTSTTSDLSLKFTYTFRY